MKNPSLLAIFFALSLPFEQISAAQNPQSLLKKSPCAFLYTQHLAGKIKLCPGEISDDQLMRNLEENSTAYQDFKTIYDEWTWNSAGNELIYNNSETCLAFLSPSSEKKIKITCSNNEQYAKEYSSYPEYWFSELVGSRLPYKILKKIFDQIKPEAIASTLNPKEETALLLKVFFLFKKEKSTDSIKLCRFLTNNGANPLSKHTENINGNTMSRCLTEYLTPQEFKALYEPQDPVDDDLYME